MMKWNFDNWITALGIYSAYSISWYLGWQLSINFETIAGIISWFIPAGIRVASLLLINKKYWAVIALAEFSAIYTINSVETPFTTILGEVIATFLPILIYMVFIHLYLKSSKHLKFNSVIEVIKVFSWTGLGASLTGVILVSSMVFHGQIIPEKLVTTILLFTLGDFVGILLLVPVAAAIKSLFIKQKSGYNFSQFFTWPTIAIISISLLISVLLIDQNMVYYIKLFAFIPIIIFAYRNGWLGAAISILILNVVIVLASFFAVDMGSMFEKQLYLIAISMTGLLLGAAISEQRALNSTLVSKNVELLDANNQLNILLKKNQQLAQKIVDIQEEERKYLSRELHDEIGQNITALKLHINVIKQITKKEAVIDVLETIEDIANITYKSAYNLMHSLRPGILDELGLEASLTSGNFNQLLACANIQYVTDIRGDLTLLSDQLKIAIYRITQESINNAAKYSKAAHLWLTLSLEEAVLTLEIKDDGVGFNAAVKNNQSSFGLQGIEDRIIALGGKYYLKSSYSGTTHRAELYINH